MNNLLMRDGNNFYANLYDIEFSDKVDDIPFILAYAKKQEGRVLELGCGTGRIIIPIAEAGIKVTGIDNSLHMLKIAKDKIAQRPQAVQKNIELVHAQMQNFTLRRRFSLIICVFNTFMHIISKEEQLQVLKNVRQHLEKNGVFINETFIPSFAFREKNAQYKIIDRKKGIAFKKIEELRYNYNTQILCVNYIYQQINNKNATGDHYAYFFQLRYTLYPEMRELMLTSGLKIVDVFSDYNRKPFVGGKRMIIVAKKL